MKKTLGIDDTPENNLENCHSSDIVVCVYILHVISNHFPSGLQFVCICR